MERSAVSKLYILLSACKPNDERIAKGTLISQIQEMDQYKALRVNQAARRLSREIYNKESLKNLSIQQLMDVQKIMLFINELVSDLQDVIQFGDISKIDKSIEIDYYNYLSVNGFIEMLKSIPREGINITNIPADDPWKIFEDDTVVSINEGMNLMDIEDIDSLEMAITNKLEGKVYCISSTEIAAQRHIYRDMFRKVQTAEIKLEIVRNKILFKKVLLGIICAGVITVFILQNNYLLPYALWLYLMFFAVFTVYLIVG